MDTFTLYTRRSQAIQKLLYGDALEAFIGLNLCVWRDFQLEGGDQF